MRPLLALLAACTAAPTPRPPPAPSARFDEPAVVVFVVLDTVRADHTSLCGYERPTTPFLERLRDVRGAAVTCGANASASWTLPSHAGMFTGTTLLEHHYDSAVPPDWSGLKTVAELLGEQGFRTVMVTANPVVANAPLLTRGFELVRSAERLPDWRGSAVSEQVAAALDEVGAADRLFLFVNLMDAHDPYPEVPDGLDWVPARPAMDFKVADPEHDQPYHRFVDGRMRTENRPKFLRVLRDGYDYGVHNADAALRELLDLLDRRGLTDRGFRLVVTSDHGEFLGEHDRIRHGGAVWEPVTSVPFLYLDTTTAPKVELREHAFTHLHAFDLLTTGALPEKLRPSMAFSSANGNRYQPAANMVAVWTPDQVKLVWDRGIKGRFELATEPDELLGRNPWKHPRIRDFEAIIEQYTEHLMWRWTARGDAEARTALEQLGYTSEDP